MCMGIKKPKHLNANLRFECLPSEQIFRLGPYNQQHEEQASAEARMLSRDPSQMSAVFCRHRWERGPKIPYLLIKDVYDASELGLGNMEMITIIMGILYDISWYDVWIKNTMNIWYMNEWKYTILNSLNWTNFYYKTGYHTFLCIVVIFISLLYNTIQRL